MLLVDVEKLFDCFCTCHFSDVGRTEWRFLSTKSQMRVAVSLDECLRKHTSASVPKGRQELCENKSTNTFETSTPGAAGILWMKSRR